MNRIVSYSVGLGAALLLTVIAFGLVAAHALPSGPLVAVVIVLAFVQLLVQLVFFLHLGRAPEARWNTLLFTFTFFGILVVVLASVWIMYHLNYNMTPEQMETYIRDQSSGGI